MANVYLYNGNFLNLLELINYLLSNNTRPFNIKPINYNANMFENIINLKLENNQDIIKLYLQLYDKYILKIIYYVFISNENNKELIIYYYLLNYPKYKNSLNYMRNLKCVSETLRISQKVSRENHKMKGFVRFIELKNKVLYAKIKPDNDILYLLSIHFKNRLKNEYWMIEDVERKIISIYDKQNFYIIKTSDLIINAHNKSVDEDEFASLWQLFYQTIGIKERKNLSCRQNFMPKKYWPYLLEVRDEL